MLIMLTIRTERREQLCRKSCIPIRPIRLYDCHNKWCYCADYRGEQDEVDCRDSVDHKSRGKI
jgi:hypothetical protein